ncbi:hypothetical protein IAU59_005530 [Kwoniella sp. CBS 9459]
MSGVSRAPLPAQPTVNGASSSTTTSIARNPVRLSVAHRSTSSGTAGPSHGPTRGVSQPDAYVDSDRDEEVNVLRRSEVKRAQLIRRVERWMDRLMEETMDRPTFKKVASHITPHQYLEIAHERHLNSLCSYPLCPNPPARPYSTARRYIISTRARTIKPTEGNEEEGYCSKKCRARSTWVERRLSGEAAWLRYEVKEVELLEELEERGEFTWEPEKASEKEQSYSTPIPEADQARSLPTTVASTNTKSQRTSSRSELAPTTTGSGAPARPPPLDPENPAASLIASLTIHERPTPTAPPAPPSLKPARVPLSPEHPSSPTATPQPQPQPQPLTSPHSNQTLVPTPSLRDSRRVSSSLMGTSTSQLSKSIVTATKQLGPVHLAHGADSDEEEEEDKESDWEKEMGWGEEDDEMKALFEEARLAREMIEE